MPAPRKYSDELRGRAQRLVAEAMSEAANVDRGVERLELNTVNYAFAVPFENLLRRDSGHHRTPRAAPSFVTAWGSVLGTSKAHCPRQLRAFPRPLPKPVDPVNGTDGSANPMVGDLRVMVDFVVAVGADVDGGVGQFGDLVQEIVLGVVGDGVGLQQADP